MKHLLSVFIAVTAGTAFAGELPYKAFSSNFATGAMTGTLCTGILATTGVVCRYGLPIDAPKLQWGIKAGAGLLGLYIVGKETYNCVDRLRNTYLQCNDIIAPHTTEAIKNRLRAERDQQDKLLESLEEKLKKNRASGNTRLTGETYLKYMQALNSSDRMHAQISNPMSAQELKKLATAEDTENGKQQAKPETLLLKSKAWGFFAGFTSAIAGIAAVCYKTGWFSSLWS